MTFDEKAKDWDTDPIHVERAFISAKEIREFIKPNPGMTAFEFGSGTGLLSYFLRNDFSAITLMDSSKGMLDVLDNKITQENITNFKTVLFDLAQNEIADENEKYDVVATSMTMHHISNIDNILEKFYKLLKPESYLCIVDLDKEDGRFHSHLDDFTGHKGFSRNEIESYLSNNGFDICLYKIIFEIERRFENNEFMKYPVFLIIGKKLSN